MRRGFSVIELLIALTLLTVTIVTVSELTLGMPIMLESARLEREAYSRADRMLTHVESIAFASFEAVTDIASTSENGFDSALDHEYLYDELAARLTAKVSWHTALGKRAYATMGSAIVDLELARDLSCSPFLEGDWTLPQVRSSLHLKPGELLPGSFPLVPYEVSTLTILGTTLIAGSETASMPGIPTLFFFRIDDPENWLTFTTAFDNASTTRVGITGIAAGANHAYVANGFGSASQTTCSDGISCAQLQIYSLEKEVPERVASLQLSTSTQPRAVTANGITAGAQSIAYRRGFVYLGLEKTVSDSEFIIIDVRNPSNPAFVSSVAIGRSVESIAVTRTHAFLATSDSNNELVVIDIRDPDQPEKVVSWNGPGTPNFGIGSTVSVRGPHVYLGRTYVNNASEFSILDISDLGTIKSIDDHDFGTALEPRSVRGTVVRDYVAAILSGKKLHFFDVTDPPNMAPLASEIPVTGTGTALTCKGNSLYVGSTESGEGFIQIVTSS